MVQEFHRTFTLAGYQQLHFAQKGKFATPHYGGLHHIGIDHDGAFAGPHQFFKGDVEIVKLPFHHPGQMKLIIFHLKHLIRHRRVHIDGLHSRKMLSNPVHFPSKRWTHRLCLVIVAHSGEGELEIGSQLVPIQSLGTHHRALPSCGRFDEPKLFSHPQMDGKRCQGLGLGEVQQLSFTDSRQNQSIVFPGHGGHPVLFQSNMGSFIPHCRLGVLLFDHELLHAFAVHFLHHALPKQVARRDRLFRTHYLFQFHMAILGLETDLSIRPCAEFSSHERDVELNDNGMRIRGDHAIALSLIRNGHG